MAVLACATPKVSYSLSSRRLEAVAAAGDDLVPVGLVPHVPHDLVARRVEYVVQREGEIDRAEAGTEVPAGAAHLGEDLVAQVTRNRGQLMHAELLQIGRDVNLIKPAHA